MTQTLPISKRIVSMEQLRQRIPLVQAEDDQFFPEWHDGLPDLTAEETTELNKHHHRYLRHRDRGELAEGTVKLLVVSPLLELAGLYDEPFFVTTEPPVEIVVQDRDEVLTGRIDTLVVQQHLWILIVESKRSLTFSAAILQALAYMLGNVQGDRPVYGMITDADLFMFIKLLNQTPPRYDFSEPFSLLVARRNHLNEILRILKRLAQRIEVPDAVEPQN